MAQKKAHEVDGWLSRPDTSKSIILFYGPDHGLVSERASRFVKQTGLPLDDPFTVVRLDATEADEGGKLSSEANTVSMFAEKRLLWVRNAQAQKGLADEIKALCAAPPEATIIVVEAGDLKKGAPLRSAVETSDRSIALPCYADAERDIDALIDEMLGLPISMEARTALRRNLGGDRLATRAELEKLALYARGKDRIELTDIQELTGDVAELSLDDAVDAILEGKLEVFDRLYQRYARSGSPVFLLANAMMRQLQTLRVLRAELDLGRRSASEIIAGARPPIFFSRKRTVENAVRKWALPSIDRALERLQYAILETRRRPDLAQAIVNRAMTALAAEAARSR
ncbi:MULTISPECIES: DNA polymerase III subunit delta [Mesorhizobium]|uniref:DNA polymerase III subunit delta n=1 Tax=Mesorhizobium denitrificans TaxID=2294114 RepID=A0A371XHE9_9HYPH|nr:MULTISPECIES: DNA polymerase III subunit delta [Mesorhizobium]RFC68474.1 DNA polymerase III subunit delta [Mesorhizobium denitrificans]